MSEHLPKYLLVLETEDSTEVVYPEKYQLKEGYEDREEYERWLQDFLNKHYEELGGFDISVDGFIVVYRLRPKNAEAEPQRLEARLKGNKVEVRV